MAALNGPFGCPKCKKKKKRQFSLPCWRIQLGTWLLPQCFIHHWCQDLTVAVALPDNASCCCLPEATCLIAAYDVPLEGHRVFSGRKPSDPRAEQQNEPWENGEVTLRCPAPGHLACISRRDVGMGTLFSHFARLSSHWVTHWRNSSKTHAQTASP